MKISLIVGARPQFIKAAPLAEALRRSHQVSIIHTGQHYDYEMSESFFSEMKIPAPDVNLGVGSGTPARQTGAMLAALENALRDIHPALVVVFGDTNSTLAGALAAAGLKISIAHVEAGLRSFNREMPEEINRVVADHLSSYLFSPTRAAVDNLKREGIGGVRLKNLPRVASTETETKSRLKSRRVFLSGDVMADTLKEYIPAARRKTRILRRIGVKARGYRLLTMHRAGNIDIPGKLENVLKALGRLDIPTVFPVHPRAAKAIKSRKMTVLPPIRMIPPVSYLEMLCLEANAAMILTDSGGVQKEAYLLKIPCVTLREETEWVETVNAGWNCLVGTDSKKLARAVKSWKRPSRHPAFYGRGDAAARIAAIINNL